MQIIRTVIWVLLLVALAIFSYANWVAVTVRIWDNLVVDTMLPAIIVVSFLIGFLPMYLYQRGSKWQANRRIAALENAARTAAATPVQQKPSTPEAPSETDLLSEPDVNEGKNLPGARLP